MICKTCGDEYTSADPFRFEDVPDPMMNLDGWVPSWGDCYGCFILAWDKDRIYEIKPPGVPSFDFAAFMAESRKRAEEYKNSQEYKNYDDTELPF